MNSTSTHRLVYTLTLVLIGTAALFANPTGGVVTSGSASIQGGPGTTRITQTSQAAIINWQNFSINSGESTLFLQPSAQSAVLNRVLGGSSSKINGSLSANGQVYLINQNGIVVGPGGVVNTAGGFTASTRDIDDNDFLNGNFHFVGHGAAGVRNLGQITSLLGNVVMIGKSVSNSGSIQASAGTVGLVAGDDVLLGQKNADGSTITVNPSPLAKTGPGKNGVTNHGTISATSAELKASNGNIYAMAINNGGTIRATTVSKQGGHIWLTSDSGQISNSGLLDASAQVAGGQGGEVDLRSAEGTVSHTGSILAEGGTGGTGGNVDISGQQLALTGAVNVTAAGGTSGDFEIDPATLDVVTTGGVGTISGGANDFYSTTINASTVDNYLQSSGNVTLSASNSITIDSLLSWSSGNTLTLATTYYPTSVTINQPISSPSGGLTLNLAGSTDPITTGSNGSISVGTFTLTSGAWNQVMNPLPSFTANNFILSGSSNFIRATGGNGSSGSPYQITDIYGLQGIGSPSGNNLGLSYAIQNNIDASVTSGWNSGQGFIPIGYTTGFTGSIAGGGFSVNNLTINSPAMSGENVGLIGLLGATGTINSLSLVGGSITAPTAYDVGSFVGINQGTISGCNSSASVNAYSGAGGFVGFNTGTITGSSATGSVNSQTGGTGAGGFADANRGSISTSYSTGTVNSAGGSPVGGFCGNNFSGATIQNSYSIGAVNASGAAAIGGFVGRQSAATTSVCYSTGSINGGTQVGGFIGSDTNGTVNDSYFATDGSGQNIGIGTTSGTTISYNGSAAGNVTGLTLAQMQFQSNFDGQWNFTLGSAGVWGIDGYASTGLINGGRPFLQTQYTAVASVVPNNQTTVYNKTNTGSGFSQTAYTATLASGISSLSSVVSGGPVLAVTGSNVNVGTTNTISISTVTPSGSTTAIELPPVTATESFSPKPITVSATAGLVAIYGNTPAFSNDGGGSQIISGDTLGGTVSYSTTDQFSPGGYLNAGTYVYAPSISGYNSNYSVTAYNPASFTINPATLTYFANSASGVAGIPFPPFSGTFVGLLPGDTQANSINGVLIFSTTAQSNSPAGFYAINGSGLSSPNYIFVQAPGNATAFNLLPQPVLPVPIPTALPSINLNSTLLQKIVGFEDSSGAVNTSFADETGTGSGLDTPPFLPRERDRDHFGKGEVLENYSGESSDIVYDRDGHRLPGFMIRQGYSPFERLGHFPPLILDRLERLLNHDVHDQLYSSTRFRDLARADRDLATILDQEGRPGRGFFIRGGRIAFSQQPVPTAIDAQLSNALSPEVRDELAAAGGGSPGGSANGGVTDQGGKPAPGFFTRGGFSSFSHGTVPPAMASRLELSLNPEVRDELYAAYLASSNSKGANVSPTGGLPTMTMMMDQKGNRVPGFMAPPGGFYGFNGAPMPTSMMDKMMHGLNEDVRDQLSNARR